MADTAYIPLRPGNYPASAAERRAQQGETVMALDFLETNLEAVMRDVKKLKAMEGILHAMYQEIRAGLAQAPDQPVTEIAPHQIASFLAGVRELLRDDPYIDTLVPHPGAAPLTRRALVMAFRQALEGFARRSVDLTARRTLLEDRLAQARTVAAALNVAENGLGYVLYRDIRGMGVEPHPAWFFDFGTSLAQFNFQKLNHTEIQAYFSQSL